MIESRGPRYWKTFNCEMNFESSCCVSKAPIMAEQAKHAGKGFMNVVVHTNVPDISVSVYR